MSIRRAMNLLPILLLSCGGSQPGGGGATQTTLTISPPGPITLYVGHSQTFIAVTNPEGKSIVWSSSDPNTISVDQDGSATALAAGTARVTATVAGGSAHLDAAVVAKQLGPNNPDFETTRACAWGLQNGTSNCADQWQDNAKAGCSTSTCIQICRQDLVPVPGVPSHGVHSLGCGHGTQVFQDNVDFGPATAMTFDYVLTRSDTSQCPAFDIYFQMIGNGTMTLWEKTMSSCDAGSTVMPLTTATVQLPSGLSTGRLMLSVNAYPNGAIALDNIQVH
jgi:hypothetical protein